MIVSGIDVETGLGVEIEFDSGIHAIRPCPDAPEGSFLAPAFIDVQVNGFAGVDYNSASTPPDEIERSIGVIHSTGVARFFPTVITGPADDMAAALRNLAGIKNSAIAGFHVEGPHLSPEEGPRGAHPLPSIRKPDVAEYRRWQDATDGRIRIVTVSPHWPEAPAYIESLVTDGVTVSIGHTHANEQEIANAVTAGAEMSTHLGNAAHAMIRKQPNYIWEQLAEDRLTASFIADGIHIQRAFLKSCIRAKGIERSVLVTDASSPAGAAPGRYYLGAQAVDLTAEGRVVLAGTDRLAGSALRMNEGIENLMRLAQLSLRDAVRMATANPARMGKVPSGLRIGAPADLVLFRVGRGIEIEATYRDGERVTRSASPDGNPADRASQTYSRAS
jgi:N-acetylglucosamine-6-phosphate deacetylase